MGGSGLRPRVAHLPFREKGPLVDVENSILIARQTIPSTAPYEGFSEAAESDIAEMLDALNSADEVTEESVKQAFLETAERYFLAGVIYRDANGEDDSAVDLTVIAETLPILEALVNTGSLTIRLALQSGAAEEETP